MIGWHHWSNGQEFGQTPGDSEGQGSLACSSAQGCKSWAWLSFWTTTKSLLISEECLDHKKPMNSWKSSIGALFRHKQNDRSRFELPMSWLQIRESLII